MARKTANPVDRTRQLVAQESARIIVEQGIADYRVAKTKAAERLGLTARGALPGNSEIEQAVSEHLKLFGRESHSSLLQMMRVAALSAMNLLDAFAPRLVGPVLHGTAAANSAVNLHVFSDSAEQVALHLQHGGIPYKPYERRLKSRRGHIDSFAGFSFAHRETTIEATVFPFDGIRQAPISPVDGRPMRRADARAVTALLEDQPRFSTGT
jgi:hypothetical protein